MSSIRIGSSPASRLGWTCLWLLVLPLALAGVNVSLSPWILLLLSGAWLADLYLLPKQVVLRCQGERWLMALPARDEQLLLSIQPLFLRCWLLVVRVSTESRCYYLWVAGDAVDKAEHWTLRRLAIRGIAPSP